MLMLPLPVHHLSLTTGHGLAYAEVVSNQG